MLRKNEIGTKTVKVKKYKFTATDVLKFRLTNL